VAHGRLRGGRAGLPGLRFAACRTATCYIRVAAARPDKRLSCEQLISTSAIGKYFLHSFFMRFQLLKGITGLVSSIHFRGFRMSAGPRAP